MNKQCHIILIIYNKLNLLSKEGTICEDTASKYFKLSSKNLTSAQMIHLLETLSNLLKVASHF